MLKDKKLLEIIACPCCKGKLLFTPNKDALLCRFDKLVFAIDDGIPVLLESEARTATEAEMAG
ncbi:Trm112 family protein [Corallincola holothuriorum]|uniref:UPF0434 protein DU002_01050 n=1 Tax=Corallincola holothuriorum TaxID=2282215 RepID=A0A368NQB2_9GAMM|nr:Trm112 family protein [Corallincola holothuriorum]RCU52588.1 Trm112 family protein [Corallincola holothuriorum]